MTSPSTPTPEEGARLASALALAGFAEAIPDTAVRMANSVFRVEQAGATYAAKLFSGAAARERLHTEATACTVLAGAGAPVPHLVAEATEPAVLVRDWIPGRPLGEILRAESVDDAAARVARGWARLHHACAAQSSSLAAPRQRAGREHRLAELRAVASAVVDSPVLHDLIPGWDRAGADVASLPDAIGAAQVAVLPLDLAPANVIIGEAGATFIDLEILGLDFPVVSLAKATMLPHDRDGGGAGQALFATAVTLDLLPFDLAEYAPMALLLALADAAGLWHDGRVDPKTALMLPRELARVTPNAQRLGALLD